MEHTMDKQTENEMEYEGDRDLASLGLPVWNGKPIELNHAMEPGCLCECRVEGLLAVC